MIENPVKIIKLEEVDSTNNYISSKLSHMDLPVCVAASFQTAGKGQGENIWQSVKGENLLFSYAFRPENLRPDESFYISRIASLAIIEFYSEHLPGVKIKWPNDILFRDRKLGGILIENRFFGNKVDVSITGMGLNINQEKFPGFSPEAGSIRSLTGKSINLEHALDSVLEKLEFWIDALNRHDLSYIAREYNRKLYRFMENALYKSGNEFFEAKISGIEEEGHLILLTPSGETRKYAFKEVEFIFS